MEQGWIKLYRKLLKWEWYDNTNAVRLFIHFLITANYEKSRWQGIDIGVGETIIGRKSLAKTLGLSEQSIRTALIKLKSTNEITTKSTNKYTIIHIENWADYQGQLTNRATNNQPTINQQSTTLKEVKNERIHTGRLKERNKKQNNAFDGLVSAKQFLVHYFERYKKRIGDKLPVYSERIILPRIEATSELFGGYDKLKKLLEVYFSETGEFYEDNKWSLTCFLSENILNKLND